MATTDNPQLNPKKTNVGGEAVEEHSLADRVKFEQHSTAQQAQTAVPAVKKMGLPIFRTRMRHGRP